ncbi:MAG TPA: hypothetical protein VMA30_23235 [Xanthobacteraceae bacterium]|nr:hypothetical protein [Xanthobacteraceae bacterium]
MKKLSLAAVLFAALVASSSAQAAKTFVGVLWPMFGPLPAIGLVELTAEIRTMPDVEVHTYLHQEWPDLVKDISHLPEGTRTIIIGYSLGANATSWVVNKSKYIDLVIALQPSMLSWNPTITGHAGRIIEVYNPNPWMTFGGMGSKKLEWTAGNIEYMPNNDSHPGAQFNLGFRDMVKTEIAKMTSEPAVEVARAEPRPEPSVKLAYAEQPSDRPLKDISQLLQKDAAQKDAAKKDAVLKELVARDEKALAQKSAATGAPIETPQADQQTAQIPMPQPRPQNLQAEPAQLITVAADFTQHQPQAWTAFLETLSGSVNSGNLAARELTVADMMNYARRTYASGKSDALSRRQASLVGGDMIVASNIDPHRSGPSGPCCAFVKADGNLD